MSERTALGVSFDPNYFGALTEADDKHFWFRARNRILEALLSQLAAEVPKDARVLEVGCGTGNVTRALVRVFGAASVVAMDPFAEAVEVARKRTGCEVVCGDLSTPVPGPFALLVMCDVLEHLEDERASLEAVRARLAPGGRLLITVPAHPRLWSSFDEEAGHFRRYEVEGLRLALEQAGFRVDYASEFFALLFPGMWAVRRLSGVRANSARGREKSRRTALAQANRVPVLNPIMEWLLSREVPLIARRKRLPIGTSIVALATATTNTAGAAIP